MSDKPKTKQTITPERRAQLIEQLARGRETSRMKRLGLAEEKIKPKPKVKKVKKLIDHEEKVINMIADNPPNNKTTKKLVTIPVVDIATDIITKPVIEPVIDKVIEPVTKPVIDKVTEPVTKPVMKQHEDLNNKNTIERPKKLRMSGIQFNPWLKSN